MSERKGKGEVILGIGTDLCDCSRIVAIVERFSRRFEHRILAPRERVASEMLTPRAKTHFLAKRWAAKEACAKALGSGFSAQITPQDFEVLNDTSGKPIVKFCHGAAVALARLTPDGYVAQVHLSLSDEGQLALAFAVISALPKIGDLHMASILPTR